MAEVTYITKYLLKNHKTEGKFEYLKQTIHFFLVKRKYFKQTKNDNGKHVKYPPDNYQKTLDLPWIFMSSLIITTKRRDYITSFKKL